MKILRLALCSAYLALFFFARSSDAWAGGKILVVDDTPTDRLVMSHVLRQYPYQIVEAASADEALVIFSQTPETFILILSDWSMPGMSGTQFADAVRRVDRTIPFVLRSSSIPNDAREREELKTAHGITHLLQKNIPWRDMESFLQQIVEALRCADDLLSSSDGSEG